MLQPQGITSRFSTITLLVCSIQFWSVANAQDFTTQVGNFDPLNLSNVVAVGDPLVFGNGPGLKGGIAYGLGFETVYDSNLFLREDDVESDLAVNLTPWFAYNTDPEGGAVASIGVTYHPVARAYLNNSDLNGFDHSGDITMKIQGAKTVLDLYSRFSEISGTDRLTGKFVTGALFNSGIQGSYQIAPRTSLNGSFLATLSDYGKSSLVGADIYTFNVGSYWSATERLSFGPAIRYAIAESSNIGTRDAWALYMQAQYLAGQRIQVQGSLGLEYSKGSRDGDSSDLGLTGNLTASYAINELWVWRNLVQYVTIPSPTDANYVVNNFLISTVLDRKFLRANVGFGLDYNLSSYEGVGPVGAEIGNENNISVYLTYRRKFFMERVDFESKLRYSTNDGQVNWEQVQVYAGIDVQF